MTLITHTEHLLPSAIQSLGYQDRKESDGLFAVLTWSVVGVAVTALMLWLGLGGQIEPFIGLG